DPSIRVPLSGYERASRPRAMRLFLALLVVFGGLYFVEHTYGTQLRERYAPGLQLFFHRTYDVLAEKLESKKLGSKLRALTGSSGKESDKQETAAVTSSDDHSADPMSSTTSPSEESLRAAPAPNAAPAAATPDAADTETASGSPPAPSPPPPTLSPSSPAPPAHAAAAPVAPATRVIPHAAVVTHSRNEPRVGRGAGRAGREPADAGDFTRASGHYNPAEIPVNVPPGVMQENLMTSRIPAYPQAAKAEGVEGQVVMQAIISKNGTVDQLHVIQGDPLLRAAASEAVSRWHYRPYTVNGRPVDVATIVKVEFKLPRRY
ncbi:MAG TPA: energy transducer TonB, partial [Edaphobacter sp.]